MFFDFRINLSMLYLLCLTDDRLLVVAGHIMESDSISVEVVENSQALLISFSVVRLGSVSSTNRENS